jgi:hypothetical protein
MFQGKPYARKPIIASVRCLNKSRFHGQGTLHEVHNSSKNNAVSTTVKLNLHGRECALLVRGGHANDQVRFMNSPITVASPLIYFQQAIQYCISIING